MLDCIFLVNNMIYYFAVILNRYLASLPNVFFFVDGFCRVGI